MSHDKIKFIIIRTLGNFFLLFSLFGMAATFGPVFYYEVLYRYNIARNIKYVVNYENPAPVISQSVPTVSIPFGTPSPLVSVSITPTSASTSTPAVTGAATFFGQLTGGNKIESLTPISSQFGIVIPKIGANAQINVDAGKPEAYLSALKKGVAHAAGTVFPGVPGNIYLFAHSTDSFWNVGRYNAVFYLLKELEPGDEIDIFFQGIRHIYRVVNRITIDPSEIEYMTRSVPYEQLTLQTCWPPGTTLKRMIILARPEKDLVR
jgi:LPXTG-site transpeptidase (sortase) family protein